MVLLALFTIGAVSVSLAVHALSSAATLLIELLIEAAATRPTVTFTGWKERRDDDDD